MPRDTLLILKESGSSQYFNWEVSNHLQTTPGDVCDYNYIIKQISDLMKRYTVRTIGFDSWNATQMAMELKEKGAPMLAVIQGAKTLNSPSKLLSSLIGKRKIWHNGNPIMQWMIGNTVMRFDPNDNVCPCKKSSADKIDGVVALIIALAVYETMPKQLQAKPEELIHEI